MTSKQSSAFRGANAAKLLAVLGLVVIGVALLTPEAPGKSEGGRSSYSSGPGGVGIAFELAQRTGWAVRRRLAPMDSVPRDTAVHVVIAPGLALGAHEVHRLLENVRRGGGLLVTLDGDDELGDSLGAFTGRPGRLLEGYNDAACPDRFSFRSRAVLAIPPEVRGVVWRHKPDGLTTIVRSDRREADSVSVAQGFPLGRGRVVVAGTSAMFANDAVRVCEWAADLAVARSLEYLRPVAGEKRILVFDEYHHGFGMHSSTIGTIRRYLSDTPSGHLLLQALPAGLVLLLALAPRPLPPVDPLRLPRRSPLEHADALAHAYADVDGTRTGAQRLMWGLRRRVGRTVSVASGASDEIFLDAVVERDASLTASVAMVRRALRDPLPAREWILVGDALRMIEQRLLLPTHRVK